MRRAAFGLLTLVLASFAWAARVPLPVPRPAGLGALDIPLPPSRPPDLVSSAPPDVPVADTCRPLLDSGKIVAQPVAPIIGPGACGIAAPIRVSAIRFEGAVDVELDPAPIIRCDLAEAIAAWVREDVAGPALAAGAPLQRLSIADSYSCRGRNRVVGAKLSEHGKGNALDIRAFGLRDGRTLEVAKQADARTFMAALKSTACLRFSTVLGPGSDGYHEDHVHVDLAPRKSAAHYCHWELPPEPKTVVPQAN